MDADVLRLILLALGAVLVVVIFLWDRYKRSRTRLKGLSVRKARRQPIFAAQDAEPGVPEQQELPHMRIADDQMEAISEDVEPGTQYEFKALDEQDYVHQESGLSDDLPQMVIQIGLVSNKGNFTGENIQEAMQAVDLQFGDMGIYHRYQRNSGKQVLFSVASMVEPGYFPDKLTSEFATPGLLIFTQLPGFEDGMAVYSDMLYTAERLRALLGGILQDDSRSALSKQQIEHTRDLILEHKRKVQLARMK